MEEENMRRERESRGGGGGLGGLKGGLLLYFIPKIYVNKKREKKQIKQNLLLLFEYG